MRFIRRFLNPKSQKKLVQQSWIEFRDSSLEAFKGAFFVALIFGFLAQATSGYVSEVLKNGIFEHHATITSPLAFMAGLLFAGLGILTRRKNKYLFWSFRYLSTSFLAFTSTLFHISSGLCFGLAFPASIDGSNYLFAFALAGSIFYAFSFVCFKTMLINRVYYSRGKYILMCLIGGLSCILSFWGMFQVLNTEVSKLIGNGF